MGDNVAQAIIDEREKNGVYKDIFDASARSMNVGKIAETISNPYRASFR